VLGGGRADHRDDDQRRRRLDGAVTIRINLGLQGGGAHGAFTWGALERLLEDDGIEVAAISGSSAGALNGAAFKAGWVRGGREGAYAELKRLWTAAGAVTDPLWSDWLAALAPSAPALASLLEASPMWQAFDLSTRLLSPSLAGLVVQSPVARLIETLDFDSVCAASGPELHVAATNVRTGKIRLFSGPEVSARAILASACLPTIFPPVVMLDPRTGREEAFWDGGYSGNPALFPLFPAHLPDDILIVGINPVLRDELPVEPLRIMNRINEISFNSSLLRELRAIAFVKRLIAGGLVAKGAMKDVLVHMVSDDALMTELNVATKTIPVAVVLARLRAAGHEAMDRFLAAHRDDLGRRGTLDLAAMLA
jgi:NTE family protein